MSKTTSVPHVPSPAEAATRGASAIVAQRTADLLRGIANSGGRRSSICDTRDVCETIAAALRARGWTTHVGRRQGKKNADHRLTVGQPHTPCAGPECPECEGTGIVPR